MKNTLWMAVTADKYELPIALEDTSDKLAKKMHVTGSTIRCMETMRRSERVKDKIIRPTKFGQPYRVVKVEV